MGRSVGVIAVLPPPSSDSVTFWHFGKCTKLNSHWNRYWVLCYQFRHERGHGLADKRTFDPHGLRSSKKCSFQADTSQVRPFFVRDEQVIL